MPDTVTVYTSESPLRNPLRLVRGIFVEIWQARELIGILFSRDLKSAYRQSYLGYFWIVASPLMTAALWIFLGKNQVVNTGDTGIPKAAFIIIGTTLWSIFNNAFNVPLNSFNGGRTVFMKLKVTPEAFIATGLAKVLFDTAIRFFLLILPCLLFYQLFSGWHLLLFPFALLTLVLFATALGYLLIPLGGLYTDVGRFTGLLLPILMYATPVVYTVPSTKNLLYYLMEFNPITPLIMASRDWLTTGSSFYAPELVVIFLVSLPILLLGMVLLRIALPHLIVRMGM